MKLYYLWASPSIEANRIFYFLINKWGIFSQKYLDSKLNLRLRKKIQSNICFQNYNGIYLYNINFNNIFKLRYKNVFQLEIEINPAKYEIYFWANNELKPFRSSSLKIMNRQLKKIQKFEQLPYIYLNEFFISKEQITDIKIY